METRRPRQRMDPRRCRWPGASLIMRVLAACWHTACWQLNLRHSLITITMCVCRSLGKAGVRRLGQPGEDSPQQNVDALILALHGKDPLEELKARSTSSLLCRPRHAHVLQQPWSSPSKCRALHWAFADLPRTLAMSSLCVSACVADLKPGLYERCIRHHARHA